MTNVRSISWRQHRHLLGVALLLPVFVGIYYLSYWLRFEGQVGDYHYLSFRNTVGWIVMVKLGWFAGLRVCQGWRRSVTFYDLIVLMQAATGALVTMAMIQYLLAPLPNIPRSIFLLDWGTTIVILGGARSLVRGFREMRWSLFSPTDRVRVLIAGAGETSVSMLRAIRRISSPRYQVVGFIDPNSQLLGTYIEGVPVLGVCEHADRLVEHHRIRQILVVQGELPGQKLRALVEAARRGACEVRVIPN